MSASGEKILNIIAPPNRDVSRNAMSVDENRASMNWPPETGSGSSGIQEGPKER